MPRPLIDIRPHKDDVRRWLLEDRLSQKEVCDRLRERGVPITVPTLQARIRDMDLRVNRPSVTEEQMRQLRSRIIHYVHVLRVTDNRGVRLLAADGFDINIRKYREIRKELGMRKPSGFQGLMPLSAIEPGTEREVQRRPGPPTGTLCRKRKPSETAQQVAEKRVQPDHGPTIENLLNPLSAAEQAEETDLQYEPGPDLILDPALTNQERAS